MTKPIEVLKYLRPNGGYVQYGDEYEGITFEPECEPFTKDEYEAAFDLVNAAKAKAEADALAKRNAAIAKLEALGLNEEDLKALGF